MCFDCMYRTAEGTVPLKYTSHLSRTELWFYFEFHSDRREVEAARKLPVERVYRN